MLSPVRPSVIYSVHAPYSAGWNFWQCFYVIWYTLAIRWGKILWISLRGTPPSRGRGVNARGVDKYSNFRYCITSVNECTVVHGLRIEGSVLSLPIGTKMHILNIKFQAMYRKLSGLKRPEAPMFTKPPKRKRKI